MNKEIIITTSNELGIKPNQVEATLKLLMDGNTVPFIARYRKEATGALNEEEIRAISEKYEYQVNLLKRKEDVIRLIDEKGLLNDLDLDMGIGKTLITSIITGKTNLNTGIGGLTLNIIGNTSDYKFKVDKGIGNVTLNGKTLSDGSVVGNGDNYIYINSGIGEVKININ